MKRVILLLLVLAILGAGLWYVIKSDRADQQSMNELYARAEPLERQKRALEEERRNLNEEYNMLLRDPSTLEILFREMDENLFLEVYPLMRDRGIKGVLGINLHEYPGLFTKLPREQYDRLLMDGWGTCLIFEEGYPFDVWSTYILSWLERDGLSVPRAIYFPGNTYDPTWDEDLLSMGIDTVILDAQDGHSSTVTEIRQLWFTGAMPWNYTGVNSDIELLSFTDGGNLVFTVSFTSLWDAYEEESFTSILDSLQKVLVVQNLLETEMIVAATPAPAGMAPVQPTAAIDPKISVTSFEQARSDHQSLLDNRDSIIHERESRQAELDALIADLDEQISAIYEDWRSRS